LADGEFYRVGGHTAVKVDVRIIAATHQNLENLVAENRFREDLFHRLNVIRVHLPRLADRREDIPQLMEHFFHRAAKELEMEPKILSQPAEDFFFNLPWPGNVRQLENICRWLTVMAAGREVLLSDLPPELQSEDGEKEVRVQGDWQQMLRRWSERELKIGRRDILAQAIPEFERTMIETAMAHTGGRKKDAAQLLGWGRNTLTRKLQEYDMESQSAD
jgi:two-component system nitrogen regulation response regulator GlnG